MIFVLGLSIEKRSVEKHFGRLSEWPSRRSRLYSASHIHLSQIQKTFITDSQYTNKTKPLVDLNAFLTIAALSWKNQTSFSFNRVSLIHSKSFRLPFMYCWFCKQYRGSAFKFYHFDTKVTDKLVLLKYFVILRCHYLNFQMNVFKLCANKNSMIFFQLWGKKPPLAYREIEKNWLE